MQQLKGMQMQRLCWQQLLLLPWSSQSPTVTWGQRLLKRRRVGRLGRLGRRAGTGQQLPQAEAAAGLLLLLLLQQQVRLGVATGASRQS
jgi:hypothetical protein